MDSKNQMTTTEKKQCICCYTDGHGQCGAEEHMCMCVRFRLSSSDLKYYQSPCRATTHLCICHYKTLYPNEFKFVINCKHH